MFYFLHVTDKILEAKALSGAIKSWANESVALLKGTLRKTLSSLNRNDTGRRPSLRDFVKTMLKGIALQTMSGDRCSALW